MREVTITGSVAATVADARRTLGDLFAGGGRFLVTAATGDRREVTFDDDPTVAPDPLTFWQGIFPRDGTYRVEAFAKAVHVTEPFAEWFLEQLLEEARKHFGKVQDAVLRVMDRLIRERAGHLTDPAVLAEFEQARHLLRQGVRWSIGAPIPEGVDQTLRRLGFGDVGVLDWPGIAYRMGAVRDELDAPSGKIRDWQRVMAFATTGPVNVVDRAAMAAARERVARYLTPVVLRGGEVMTDAALAREQRQLRTMTVHAIANETHPLQLAREFHGRFDPQGIERDWMRVARTEIMNARLEGAFKAEAAARAWTAETKIYRQTAADPCSGCLRLHRNPDGTPKLYTVAEVEASDALGPNRGPWREWTPKIGSSHPNDRCSPWATYTPALASVFGRHAPKWAAVMRERGLGGATAAS